MLDRAFIDRQDLIEFSDHGPQHLQQCSKKKVLGIMMAIFLGIFKLVSMGIAISMILKGNQPK